MAHEQDDWLGIDWLYSTYMWVWAALLILTVVEVLVPEPSLVGLQSFSATFTVLALILLALTKTFCVAWYYMHLIDERPAIILIACAPFLFSVFLTIGLWPHSNPNPPEKTPDDRAKEKDEESARFDWRGDSDRVASVVDVQQGLRLADEVRNRRR